MLRWEARTPNLSPAIALRVLLFVLFPQYELQRVICYLDVFRKLDMLHGSTTACGKARRNSLRERSQDEELLLHLRTTCSIQVWDIKGALTSPGTEDESRQMAKTSKDRISKMVHNDSSSITIDSSTISGEDKEKEKERNENDDKQQNNTANDNYNDTITTDNPDNINNDIDVDINDMVAMKHEEEENEGPETPSHRGSAQLTACIPPPSMAPLDANLRDDLSSLGPADGDATSSDWDDGIGVNGGSKPAGTSSSAHGEHSTLWSSEPSESISGEDYGDRWVWPKTIHVRRLFSPFFVAEVRFHGSFSVRCPTPPLSLVLGQRSSRSLSS